MKRRRGRRSLVWWSWLLALVTIGCVVAGYMYGEKQWKEAPKDYLATARVTFHIRPPFVSKKTGVQVSAGAMSNANEQEVLRLLESEDVLGKVVGQLNLTGKWSLGTSAAVNKIKTGLQLDLDKETNHLIIEVTLNDPAESAEVANALAGLVPSTIQEFDDQKRAAAAELLASEARPLMDQEAKTKEKLAAVLKEKGINIEVSPEMRLGAYQFMDELVTAKLEWDSARNDLNELADDQREYRNYWQRSVQTSRIETRAEAPQGFVGPPVKPFQMRWATWGLTAGMALGSLLMLLCWKLFP